VPGQQRGFGRGRLGEALLQRLGDPPVELLPPGLEQALVGRVPHQRVLERVARPAAAPEDQLRRLELAERVAQPVVAEPGHGRQQLAAELPPDHRRDLGHLLDRRQPVQPGHERVLERRGDRQRRQRAGQLVPVADVPEQARLQHRLGQLLDEQRHPVRPGQDLVEHLRRQRLAPGQPLDHRPALPPAEPAERERGDVPVARPGRGEAGPRRDDGEHGQALHALGHQAQDLERARVGPVDVLVERQHGPARGQARQLVEQDLEGALLALLRAEIQRRVAARGRDAEQVGEHRRAPRDVVRRQGEQGLEPVEPGPRRVVAPQPGRPLQLAGHHVERGVGVLGRAELAERRVRLALQPLAERARQARLADPGLAREQHDLALAVPGPPPAVEQQRQLVPAADQRGEPGRGVRPRSGPRPPPRPRPRRRAPARRSP
jgi:hypothetical protein